MGVFGSDKLDGSYTPGPSRKKTPKPKAPKPATTAPPYTSAPYRANPGMGRLGFVEAKHGVTPAKQKAAKVSTPAAPKATKPKSNGASTAKIPAVKTKSGGTAARAVTTTATSAPVGRPKGTSAGARARNQAAATEGKASGTAAADDVLNVSSLYDSARRSLDAERARADALRQQRINDMAKFDEFMKQARSAGQTTLQQQFAASASQAQTAQNDVASRINALAQQAVGQATGNQEILNNAGLGAVNQAYGFRAQGDAASSAANAFNTANLMQNAVNAQGADFARSGERRADVENRYDKFLAGLAQQGRTIDQDEIKAKIQQQNADRQYELDKASADFLNQYKTAQLGVAQSNAETNRLNAQTKLVQIKNQATLQQAKLKLQAQVEAGKLTVAQANLALRQQIQQSNLTNAQKNRALKLRIATMQSNGGNVMKDSPTWLQKFVQTRMSQNGVTAFNAGGDPFRASTVRGAIDAMAAQYPAMTQKQAWQLLSSQFGAELMNSNISTPTSYLAQVNARFKRG